MCVRVQPSKLHIKLNILRLKRVRAMPDQEAARISSYFVQKLLQCQYIEESDKEIKYQRAY